MTEKSPEKTGPGISLAGDVEGEQQDCQNGHNAYRRGHGSNEISGVPHAASAKHSPNLKGQVYRRDQAESQKSECRKVVDRGHSGDSTREGGERSLQPPEPRPAEVKRTDLVSPVAERMRLYRARKREGLVCVRVWADRLWLADMLYQVGELVSADTDDTASLEAANQRLTDWLIEEAKEERAGRVTRNGVG